MTVGWQPIESAPRDGTAFEGLFHGSWPPVRKTYWGGFDALGEIPTHWMPLPEPPKDDA